MVVTTGKDGAICGFGFSTDGDAKYLVYANGKPEELTTSLCTRTATLDAAKDDLKELGESQKPLESKK